MIKSLLLNLVQWCLIFLSYWNFFGFQALLRILFKTFFTFLLYSFKNIFFHSKGNEFGEVKIKYQTHSNMISRIVSIVVHCLLQTIRLHLIQQFLYEWYSKYLPEGVIIIVLMCWALSMKCEKPFY